MTTIPVPSTDLVVSVEPLFTEAERTALVGFLAGYSGLHGTPWLLGWVTARNGPHPDRGGAPCPSPSPRRRPVRGWTTCRRYDRGDDRDSASSL
jgi:hypothetical protein